MVPAAAAAAAAVQVGCASHGDRRDRAVPCSATVFKLAVTVVPVTVPVTERLTRKLARRGTGSSCGRRPPVASASGRDHLELKLAIMMVTGSHNDTAAGGVRGVLPPHHSVTRTI